MSSKSVPPVAHCEVSELHTVAQKEAAEKKPPAYLKSMECCLVYLFCLPPKIILRPVLSQLSINFTSKSYFYLILIQVVDSVKSITCKIFYRKTPEALRFRGILRLDTMVPFDTDINLYAVLYLNFALLIAYSKLLDDSSNTT